VSICPVCTTPMHAAFDATVLGTYSVTYFRCDACGLILAEHPFWLEEAYCDAISRTDTGLVQRNAVIGSRLASLILAHFDPQAAYLDLAGGYGLLVRLMRDRGFDFYWSDKYCSNLLARGFEAEMAQGPFKALTAFEVREHVPDPIAFVSDAMLEHSSDTLVFSTLLYEGKSAPPKDWWYYSFETGQHISFYQERTFREIAARLNLSFHTSRGLHILTRCPKRFGDIGVRLSGLARKALRSIVEKPVSKTLADRALLIGRD
jgi:hypothetical protein